MDTRRRRKYISAAYRYAFSGLVLNYYLYYESLWETPESSQEEREAGEEFGRILREFLEGRNALEDLDKLRSRIIKRMEILTGFSDCFQIYEYVLNRLERRFLSRMDSEYTPERLAMELVHSIALETSSAEQNERIRNIVAQLPVRFTKQKFYSMVMEALSLYAGAKQKDVERFLDMLKTSSMVKLPEYMETEEELYGILEDLRRRDYRSIDKEGFEQCDLGISRGSHILVDSIDRFVMLADLANDLYVLFLTRQEAIINAAEDQAFKEAASSILNALAGDTWCITEEEGEELLSRMEGIQESVEDLVMGGSEEGDETLDKVEKLLSGNHFMSLDGEEVSEETADKAWLKKQAQEFCMDLDQMFKGLPKAVVRGVMAKVLSSLPVIFHDSIEVEEYIRSSLESCSDHSEREACMELLEQELITDVMV